MCLDTLLWKTAGECFFISQYALRSITTPSHLASRTKQRNGIETAKEFQVELTQTMSIVQFQFSSSPWNW